MGWKGEVLWRSRLHGAEIAVSRRVRGRRSWQRVQQIMRSEPGPQPTVLEVGPRKKRGPGVTARVPCEGRIGYEASAPLASEMKLMLNPGAAALPSDCLYSPQSLM